MKKILITGAGSFIGTSFEKYIAKHPKHDEYQVEETDTKDSFNASILADYDIVFHVAGIAHSDVGKATDEEKELYRRVNTEFAIDTAKKAKAAGVKQFIFMSSAIVFGASSPIGKEKCVTADFKPEPDNFYGESKLNAEKGLNELRDDDFKVVILRPPMIYGPGCKGNYNSLRKFALKMPLFPKVNNSRSMLYIDNLCEFVRLMIDNEESGTFHPANKENTNTSEMVRMIALEHGKKLKLVGGFTWLLKIMRVFTGLVDKAFGNLTYDEAIKKYKDEYSLVSLEESISLTEEYYCENQ